MPIAAATAVAATSHLNATESDFAVLTCQSPIVGDDPVNGMPRAPARAD